MTHKTAVFCFGRMNPPTMGHQKLIEYGQSLALAERADFLLFPSPSVDKIPKTKPLNPLKSKNPIPFTTKVAYLRQVFPLINIIENEKIRSPQQVTEYLDLNGYTSVIFVVGSDRVEAFTNRWLPYALDVFDVATVVSCGDRTDDNKSIAGMSASAARTAAIENDINCFMSATGWSETNSKYLMEQVRQGMGITNEHRQPIQDKIIDIESV